MTSRNRRRRRSYSRERLCVRTSHHSQSPTIRCDVCDRLRRRQLGANLWCECGRIDKCHPFVGTGWLQRIRTRDRVDTGD